MPSVSDFILFKSSLSLTEVELELVDGRPETRNLATVDHINVFRWQCIFKMIIKILSLSHKKHAPLMRLNEEKFWYFNILEIPMTEEMNTVFTFLSRDQRIDIGPNWSEILDFSGHGLILFWSVNSSSNASKILLKAILRLKLEAKLVLKSCMQAFPVCISYKHICQTNLRKPITLR